MATGLCNHHRGTILPGFPPQAFPLGGQRWSLTNKGKPWTVLELGAHSLQEPASGGSDRWDRRAGTPLCTSVSHLPHHIPLGPQKCFVDSTTTLLRGGQQMPPRQYRNFRRFSSLPERLQQGLQYHHNHWRNQASYCYIPGKSNPSEPGCSAPEPGCGPEGSHHCLGHPTLRGTWHTHRRPLLQAMCCSLGWPAARSGGWPQLSNMVSKTRSSNPSEGKERTRLLGILGVAAVWTPSHK